MTNEQFCKLKNQQIDEAHCYEINMALVGLIKVDAVDSSLNREKDLLVCQSCPFSCFKENK